jgi:hypothetical protein
MRVGKLGYYQDYAESLVIESIQKNIEIGLSNYRLGAVFKSLSLV